MESTQERPPFWPPKLPDGTPNHTQAARESRERTTRATWINEWCNDCQVWHA